MDTADVGLLYTSRITKMIEIETKAKEMGFSPVCVWSTANKDHAMTEEQLAVRDTMDDFLDWVEEYECLTDDD